MLITVSGLTRHRKQRPEQREPDPCALRSATPSFLAEWAIPETSSCRADSNSGFAPQIVEIRRRLLTAVDGAIVPKGAVYRRERHRRDDRLVQPA
jgi:hypothetical protein